jgi:hypothetical protein
MSKPAKPKGQAQAKAPGAQAQATPCEHAPRQGCPWLNAAATDLQLATMGEAQAKARVAELEHTLAMAPIHGREQMLQHQQVLLEQAHAHIQELELQLASAQAQIADLEDQLTDEGLAPREALAQQKAVEKSWAQAQMDASRQQAQEHCLEKSNKMQPCSTCPAGCLGCQGHPGPRHTCMKIGCTGCQGQAQPGKQVLCISDPYVGSGPSPLQQAVQMAQEVPNLPALQQLQKEMARKTRVGIGGGENPEQ